MDKLTEEAIRKLVSKAELSTSEIVSILFSSITGNGNLLNISLFNEWVQHRYNYHSSVHNTLIFRDIELSNIDLTNIDLRYTEIVNCNFKNCNFTNASLWDTTIVNTKFWDGQFDDINLRGSTILNCKLDDISASGQICLIETILKNTRISFKCSELLELDFSASNLSDVLITVPTMQKNGGYTTINPIGLDGNDPVSKVNIHSINFSYSILDKVKLSNLGIYNFIANHANISNSDIINTTVVNELQLNGVRINGLRAKAKLFEQFAIYIEKAINDHTVTNADHEATTTIRDNFKIINDSTARARYNILEKEILRTLKYNDICNMPPNLKPKSIIAFSILSLLKWISNYGESPAKVFLWIFGVIFSVGCLSYSLNWACEESFWRNIYFSIITFSTVGYGDISPKDEIGRFVFALEGLSGIFLMSLFVVSLAKKWLED